MRTIMKVLTIAFFKIPFFVFRTIACQIFSPNSAIEVQFHNLTFQKTLLLLAEILNPPLIGIV